MNKKIKREWLKALRSGEYEQSQGVLYESLPSGDSFCCLGVLIDSCIEGEWSNQGGSVWKFDGEYSWLPDSVKGIAKITHKHERTLVKMNDRGRSFSSIADYIEAKL